jgi:hypothetical protein
MLNYLCPFRLLDTAATRPPATDRGFGWRFGGHAG